MQLVHQKSDRAEIHPIDRDTFAKNACSVLQHEPVAAKRDNDRSCLGPASP
jgi:hypothetical protein